MVFVLTNDDGIDAPGLQALLEALRCQQMDDWVVVAPDAPLSGCSHQLTRGYPIAMERRSPAAIAIRGTPADCARVAIHHLVPQANWVLSGINAGGNLGADIYVSGTVAAVREARLNRVPGIAISHYIHKGRPIDWAIATRLAAKVLAFLLPHPLPEGSFWNVNLPHLMPNDPDPNIVFCRACTQPLPTDYEIEGDTLRFVGSYDQRPRDPGSDVEVCFSGHIAVSQIDLW